MILSGMGADELFGGYRKHLACLMASRYGRLPGPARAADHIGHRAAVCNPTAIARPRVRHQGWRRGWSIKTGHPDGGLQPPSHRRCPCDRRGAQPGRRVPRQPSPPRQCAGHRHPRHPLAARRRYQRPRVAPCRDRPRRTRERHPARDRVGDHGRLRGHGRARPRHGPAGPPGTPRAHGHGDHPATARRSRPRISASLARWLSCSRTP